MVLAYYPQRSRQSLDTNSNFPPQGFDGGVPIVVGDTMAYEPAGWFNANFQQRIALTINAGQVPSTQTDFPLLINDVYPDLIGAVEAELRITGVENLQLDYEIQKFDNSTGELIAWVKKPSVSDGDIIRIYFDNPGAVDEQNPSAVWSSGYEAVWHLDGDFLDSTSNGNEATNNGSSNIVGKIGDARDFDGVDDFLEIADSPSLNFIDQVTLSAWIKSDDTFSGWIMGKDNLGDDRPWSIRRDFTILRFGIDTGIVLFLDGAITLSTTQFTLVTATYDGTTMKTYVDGVLDTTRTQTGNIVTPAINTFIGKRGDDALEFEGIIDEPRISSVAYTDDYIKTEFNNQNSQSTFYSTPVVESVPAATIAMAYEPAGWFNANFQQRIALTINAGQVPSTQTDFPLLINDVYPDLIGAVEAELRITDGNNILLDYEVELFDSGSGELVAWAKKPTVDDGDIVNIYFDNPGALDASNPTGVWDANYQGVYHLNGTVFSTNSILDSTINGNNGTPTGTVTSETVGPIGKATRFGGTSNIMFPISLMSDMNAVGTVSLFANFDSDVTLFPMTFSQRSGGNTWEMFLQNGLTDIALRYGDGFVEEKVDIPGLVGTGENHIITAIWDQPNSRLKIFLDGDKLLDNTITPWTLNSTDDKTGIGNVDPPLGNTSLVGFEDEVRFSNIVRSDDRIKTEANNYLNQSTFYSTPVVESVPAATIAMGYEN